MDSPDNRRWTPADLSALARDAFVAALDGVFEQTAWVAERAWEQRPFTTRFALWQALVSAMLAASHEEQLALIRAHPELGTRAPLSAASGGEQQAAGLRQEGADTPRLAELNAHYRARFGHPFIVAVAGLGRDDILAQLEQRLHDPPQQEFARCLGEIGRIAALRLAQRVSSA